MKRIYFFFFLLITGFSAVAQKNFDEKAAHQLVINNAAAVGFTPDDLENFVISNCYFNAAAGTQMLYLLQSFKGVPVYNQMLVLAFRNGTLISKAGGFLQGLAKLVNVKTALPATGASSAVVAALADRQLEAVRPAVLKNSGDNGRYNTFDDMGISRENITAKLIWIPIEEQVNGVATINQVRLAWQIYIIPKTTSDYWLVKIDATTNAPLGADNLTNYDHWSHPAAALCDVSSHSSETGKSVVITEATSVNSPDVLSSASYRVIPFPAESPVHGGGTPALVSDPWNAAPGNATSLKWHTGLSGTDYSYTRGNNVWAYHDNTAPLDAGGTIAKSASSTTALPTLTFNFTPNFTVTPTQTSPVQNQQFNITNLFYWNNVIHDLMYKYGFDEASANFQDDNQGRGGAGNDHVNAEAQDGGGTNNANFSTPADGGSGRMQMYLWTNPSPARDGDVDNGIVVHEYGHGISNRLTGGGSSGCLGNAEQMGEGWSDYYALMFTQNWATSNLNTGFTTPRGIGTYALNQPVTGLGIRSQRYCTNFSVNNKVYAASIPAAAHDRGELWCAVLWDMTWNIINQAGFITANLYDATAGGGNVIAMKLVTEGLKLQQCSPGFISGRNAILQADQNLYGGAYRCAIINAFARRGMGTRASEGSTNSVTDQVADFSVRDLDLSLTQSGIISVPEGQNIAYTNSVTARCAAVTNYTLRDTLPSNVTFVSATNGGTYNAATRVVSWPVSVAANATMNYEFTVRVNAGAYFPPYVLINEPVANPAISGFWTASSTTGNTWTAHSARKRSAPYSFFTPNAGVVSDQRLATTSSFALDGNPPVLSFWHLYQSEATWDGGVLEISTNGGSTWADIGAANFLQNGYNATLRAGSGNPLAGRAAWSGGSAGFIESRVNMTAYANQANVRLRWRFGSDPEVAAVGWNIDDITLQRIASVTMKSTLFDENSTRVLIRDTVTLITAPSSLTITASAGANGTISPTGVTNMNAGANQTYTITANPCYAIADVLVNGFSVGAVSSYTFSNVQANQTISATFAIVSYSIATSAGANGSITPAGANAVSCGGGASYTITPAPCYVIADVFVNGVSVGAVSSYTFSNVLMNQTISASFARINYAITASAGSNGSITPSGTATVGCGADATFTISPAACFQVQDVLVDGASVGAVSSFTFVNVTGSHTISASFIANAPLVTPTPLTGPVNVCALIGTGQTVTYSVPQQAGATFSWLVPITVSIVSGQGTNTLTVLINDGFQQTGNKQIRVTALSPCGNSPQAIFVLVAQLPSTPVAITASSINVCTVIGTTGTITYTIPSVYSASSYIWTAQAGTTTITHPNGGGVNDTVVVVRFSSDFAASNITVQAVNPCGTSGVRSLNIARANPAKPGVIDGPANVCPYISPDGSPATYSIAPVINASFYNWNIPAGAIGFTGQGTTSISFTFPPDFTTGNVTVSATNGCGTGAERSLTVKKLVAAAPGFMDVIQTAACPNRVYSYTIAVMPANATSVQWTVPVGATLVSGQGSNSITVSYPAASINGSVTAQSINECSSSTIRTSAVRLPACPPARFALNGYDAAKTNGNGETKKYLPQSINTAYLNVQVYPNPSVHDFKLQVATSGQESISVRILDVQGRQLKQSTVMPFQTVNVGGELKPGIYLIEVRQDKLQSTRRVVKF